jgi:hypothetical protein
VSVAVASANQAFTALNGAADQSRNAIINLTTSTSADFAIYAPPESKQYTIKNASSFTATIYNSTALGNTTAAGAGVAIPAGKTMTVWSEGVNFAVQNNRFVGELDGSIASATTAVTQAPGTSTTQIATTEFASAAFQGAYPVGSIYMNASVATNPGTLFGFGTWVAFGAGRVPVGFNAADPSFDTAEKTGGSKDAIVVSHTHTGTTGAAGEHAHGLSFIAPDNASGGKAAFTNFDNGGTAGYVTDAAGTHTHAFTTASTGSSGTNANLQPYITVYMWKRTA